MDERKLIYADDAIRWIKIECNPYGKPTLDFESGKKVIEYLERLPSAQPEITDEQAIEHLQSTGWMQNHDKQMYEMGLKEQLADDSGSYDSLIPSAQPEHLVKESGNLVKGLVNDCISRQAAIAAIKEWGLLDGLSEGQAIEILADEEKVPSAQPEPLTDKEQRIFLAAMGREEKVCKQVDDEYRDCMEPYEDSLVRTCHEITRKVKGALWT